MPASLHCETSRRVAGVLALALAGGCASRGASAARDLEVLGPDWVGQHSVTYASILAHALAADAYVCEPAPAQVFFGATPAGVRSIAGSMPHYDVYDGPMRYQLRRAQGQWFVQAWVIVEPPPNTGRMELPDCSLEALLEGPVQCSGRPYSQSPTRDICPEGGSFSAPVTRKNVRVLLAHWSTAVEGYYNRDAKAQRLPVSYDFTFTVPEARAVPASSALVVPLATSCARTPYFQAVRSGWSVPILVHEMGHLLGLLDEYAALSGIVDFYPKAPFVGAERSRMGLSMRDSTVLLPLHHYLVLRRFFCPEPAGFADAVCF
ncbi:MAG TPA: hypothetical protein VFU02_08515 [Polyangiaceae bacterium]|nr:hypothetical protein [Polyangiaceae bacterium]